MTNERKTFTVKQRAQLSAVPVRSGWGEEADSLNITEIN